MVTIAEIRDARAHLDGRVHRTPLLACSSLTKRLGVRFAIKAELFQKTGSFKVRGVLNRIRQLDDEQRARGLISISAGNHAQALAWAASAAGVSATIVMPAHASPAKVAASRGYGADIVLHGDVHAAFAKMDELIAEHGYTLVHPFDDEGIIAGHGTMGIEIVEDLPDVDDVIVPVGGGALLAGIATAVRALRPEARVWGVEPEGAAGMRAALDAGRVVRLEHVHSVADGLAPPMAGERPLEHVRAHVHDVVTVRDADIIEATKLMMTRAKLYVEPSGAAGLAALLSGRIRPAAESRVVVVASGGNLDLDRLKEMI
ncbi:MAG: pyridoxal-phosphate dependent enzyme [Gemmatimonadetes bacterium]|nr:pyridoxal-phosphate dependent enzyme [Gemmatimonadota bacterium]